ncbi:MAG: hypothetical protein J6D15_00075 [Clostridia bacterium]|nr:hypothetical protein [Clostridia bacterium]
MIKKVIIKMFAVVVLFSVCFIVGNSEVLQLKRGAYEKGNDNLHISAAREISAFEGVIDAAVISCEGKTMAGISIDENCDQEEVMLFAESALKRILGENEVFYVSVGDETAEKIIELGLYLDTDMDKGILKQRTRFLLKKNNEI